jgi:tRNA dimethylallyltransferase
MHIISIVGPTAVGKSALALGLAEKWLAEGKLEGVDLISADSRQVYKGMEILSGADEPPANARIQLHGVSIIEPTQEWSLAHFHQLASQVIERAVVNNRAVIVVGGTGLYQTQLLQGEIAGQSPPLPEVRAKAGRMSVTELQAWLDELDAGAVAELNDSDRANPRRLIRAIERTLWQQQNPIIATVPSAHTQEFIGLQTTKEDLANRIRRRVIQRLESGVVNEVTLLEARLDELGTPLASVPAHTACGLREVLAFSRGEIDREQCIEFWTQREVSYARRQDTWWKKYPAVRWIPANTLATTLL